MSAYYRQRDGIVKSVGELSATARRGLPNAFRRPVPRDSGKRKHLPLIRRHPTPQCLEIDLSLRRRSAAFDDLDPAVEPRCEAGTRRAEARVDAARPPFLGALAY